MRGWALPVDPDATGFAVVRILTNRARFLQPVELPHGFEGDLAFIISDLEPFGSPSL
jgi:hypothetical protein